MATYRTVDESFGRLHAAGWSVGDVRIVTAEGESLWLVTGSKGVNQISARAPTQSEAWHLACRQAETLHMPRKTRPAIVSRGMGVFLLRLAGWLFFTACAALGVAWMAATEDAQLRFAAGVWTAAHVLALVLLARDAIWDMRSPRREFQDVEEPIP